MESTRLIGFFLLLIAISNYNCKSDTDQNKIFYKTLLTESYPNIQVYLQSWLLKIENNPENKNEKLKYTNAKINADLFFYQNPGNTIEPLINDNNPLSRITLSNYYYHTLHYSKADSILGLIDQENIDNNLLESEFFLLKRKLDLAFNRELPDELSFILKRELELKNGSLYEKFLYIELLFIKSQLIKIGNKHNAAAAVIHYILSYLNAENLGDAFIDHKAMAYNHLAVIHFQNENYELADHYWQKANGYFHKSPRGSFFLKKNRLNQTLLMDTLKEKIDVLKYAISDTSVWSPYLDFYANNLLGNLLGKQDKSELQKSLQYFENALEVFPSGSDCYQEKRRIYDLIAKTYLRHNMIDSALVYNQKNLNKEDCKVWNKKSGPYAVGLNTLGKIKHRHCLLTNDFDVCIDALEALQENIDYCNEAFGNDIENHYADIISENAELMLQVLNKIQIITPQFDISAWLIRILEQSTNRSLRVNEFYDNKLRSDQNLAKDKKEKIRRIDKKLDSYLQWNPSFEDTLSIDSSVYLNVYELLNEKQTIISNGSQDNLDLVKNEIINIETLRNKLREDNIHYLQYFSKNESLWLAIHNQENSVLHKLDYNTIDSLIDIQDSLLLTKGSNLYYTKRIGFELYKLLFQPFIDPEVHGVVILPSGKLNSFPFETLVIDTIEKNSWLINSHNITYSPSLQNYAKADHVSIDNPSLSLISYSDEETIASTKEKQIIDLPYGYKEVLIIDTLFSGNSEIVSGKRFTNDVLTSSLEKNIVHISTHAKSDRGNRMQNYLITQSQNKEENKIFGFDIRSMDTQTKLVVLSGCETGTGEWTDGLGTYSLSNDFLTIGAEAVTKTFWQVDDKSSMDIMVEYYRQMEYNNLSSALRNAKLNYLKSADAEHQHPYYWAGYVLEGNGLLKFNF